MKGTPCLPSLLLALSLALLPACGEKPLADVAPPADAGAPVEEPGSEEPTAGSTERPEKRVVFADGKNPYANSWQTNCIEFSGGGSEHEITIRHDTWEWHTYRYSRAHCGGSGDVHFEMSGTYEFGRKLTPSSHEIDLVIESVKVEMLSILFANRCNIRKFFGHSDWKTGRENAKEVWGGNFPDQPEAGAPFPRFYQKLKLENGELVIGAFNSVSDHTDSEHRTDFSEERSLRFESSFAAKP